MRPARSRLREVSARGVRPPGAAAARPGYREDLDGLRGLAIALVVAFHVWFGRVSGGVDIFLVLSGYFFTGSLMRRACARGSVGLRDTGWRTARRLLPALVVVLAAVCVTTVFVEPYTQWAGLATQTVASLLYVQNWQLALTSSDYLAADPSVSPLQHLWSMSVQGQFYLVLALGLAALVAVCRRWGADRLRAVVAVAMAGAAALSFSYAAQGVVTHQRWNYYDSLARAWEPLAGGLLAVLAPMIVVPAILRVVLAFAGSLAVLSCGWVLDGAAAFPGPQALVPVCAALALILAGNTAGRRPYPNRLLASPALVRLGELAYALYLWHWPVLIFVLAETGSAGADIETGTVVIGISLLLATVTNRLVERPLRASSGAAVSPARRRTGWAVGATGVVVLVTAVGTPLVLRPNLPVALLDPTLYPGAEALASGAATPTARMRPTVLEAAVEHSYPTRDGCIADWYTGDVITCDYGDLGAERTIAVVGSSHAEHWVPALDVLARKHGFRITVYLKMGCPLTVDENPSYRGEPIPDCLDWSREVIDRLGADRPDWVFTTGTRPRAGAGDETPEDYAHVWAELAERGLRVLAMRDTPWLRRDGVRYRGIDCLAAGGNRLSCGIRRGDALDEINPAEAPAASFPEVFPLDLSDAVCETEICPISAGNILVYHDEHHLTATYSRSLAPELERTLAPILRWW